ncbi:hypothetical protein LSH36_220g01000 [Paralvinella palmiformis]|uniref:Calponin-homology (CH) domain-containing protein n=1 Tax=Paralvinella palmiformis TaxID=53620 RepID=A0AAD9N5V7_9ANNE|nr:hypothetical protein LSH36_220g01000 [Paralvinella palmiformis]
MATSVSPGSSTLKKEKEESFFEKIGGTLARRKKTKEAQEVEAEGKHAIESPTSPTVPDFGPEWYSLAENEERSMLDPSCREDPQLVTLKKILLDWINDELAHLRIIVKDLEEDLFDGQIIQKLFEKLENIKIEVPEVTQTEVGQKQKLHVILEEINHILPNAWNTDKWNVDSIHGKNLVAILHLMIALARHYKAPIRLPSNVKVNMIIVKKQGDVLLPRTIIVELTGKEEQEQGYDSQERDAFDTLVSHAPDKLNVVKTSLINFVNKHLNKVNLEVTDLDTQFHDGVYLVLLMGLLEGYFVPLYNFHLTTTSFEEMQVLPPGESNTKYKVFKNNFKHVKF